MAWVAAPAYRHPMKRFIALLVFGGLAWWAWWYTFSVDPGGDGFGFEPCSDGEGTCSDDPSVFTLIVAIVAGVVAFFLLLSVLRSIKRRVRGEAVGSPKASMAWVSNPTSALAALTQQAGSLQQGIIAAQTSMPPLMNPASGNPAYRGPAAGNPAAGNPAMVGQAGVIGNPAAANPAARNPAAGPSTRTPTPADRAASKDRWLQRAAGTGPGSRAGAASAALTGVPAYDPTPTRTTGTTGASRAMQEATAAATATNPTKASVVLVAIGPRDLGVQREVRRLTGYGLDDAKQLMATVGETPQFIAVDLPWDEAQKVRRTFERMGATVELR
jgi:ribosomal protein L7/L12